jgi:DtxR family Mn-dependent transcriptional regulator
VSHDLIDTTEMYLRTIYELEEEGVVPLRARIAERLHQSGPTVSQTVARMERDGLVHVADDRHLEFTPEGRAYAMRVMRKHRLAERLLVDVIGLDWEYVHEEACRWEHVISEQVERRLVELLHEPTESPYGTPIPGLAELRAGAPEAPAFRDGTRPLAEALAAGDAPVEVELRRIAEPLQTDVQAMAQLRAAGALPQSTLVAHLDNGQVVLTGPAGAVRLPERSTWQLFVTDRSPATEAVHR